LLLPCVYTGNLIEYIRRFFVRLPTKSDELSGMFWTKDNLRILKEKKPEIGTSTIDWAQMTRFHLKKETESSLRNIVWIMSRNTSVVIICLFGSQ
jgi:hypothetical protein